MEYHLSSNNSISISDEDVLNDLNDLLFSNDKRPAAIKNGDTILYNNSGDNSIICNENYFDKLFQNTKVPWTTEEEHDGFDFDDDTFAATTVTYTATSAVSPEATTCRLAESSSLNDLFKKKDEKSKSTDDDYSDILCVDSEQSLYDKDSVEQDRELEKLTREINDIFNAHQVHVSCSYEGEADSGKGCLTGDDQDLIPSNLRHCVEDENDLICDSNRINSRMSDIDHFDTFATINEDTSIMAITAVPDYPFTTTENKAEATVTIETTTTSDKAKYSHHTNDDNNKPTRDQRYQLLNVFLDKRKKRTEQICLQQSWKAWKFLTKQQIHFVNWILSKHENHTRKRFARKLFAVWVDLTIQNKFLIKRFQQNIQCKRKCYTFTQWKNLVEQQKHYKRELIRFQRIQEMKALSFYTTKIQQKYFHVWRYIYIGLQKRFFNKLEKKKDNVYEEKIQSIMNSHFEKHQHQHKHGDKSTRKAEEDKENNNPNYDGTKNRLESLPNKSYNENDGNLATILGHALQELLMTSIQQQRQQKQGNECVYQNVLTDHYIHRNNSDRNTSQQQKQQHSHLSYQQHNHRTSPNNDGNKENNTSHANKTLPIVSNMEQRRNERQNRRKILQQKYLLIQKEKDLKKQKELYEKELSQKEELRKQKLIEKQKKQQKQMEIMNRKKLWQKSQLHYHQICLLRNKGLKPWYRYAIENKNVKLKQAMRLHTRNSIHKVLHAWIEFTQEIRHQKLKVYEQKLQKASSHYETSIQQMCWKAWSITFIQERLNLQIELKSWYQQKLQYKLFGDWKHIAIQYQVELETIEEKGKMLLERFWIRYILLPRWKMYVKHVQKERMIQEQCDKKWKEVRQWLNE